jgi:microcystin-dependent protein
MADPTLGEIRIFAGTKPPRGWLFCDGSKLPIATNTALFSLLGTIYGGDGRKSFMLPDMRGRIMIGNGAGTGLTPCALGETGGHETIAMSADAVPKHSHQVLAASAAADSQSPALASFGTVASDALLYVDTAKPTLMPRRQFSSTAIGPSGGSGSPEPHDNIMPSVAINFIIAAQGVYPSHN